MAKLSTAAFSTGWPFFCVYHRPHTTAEISSVKKKMVPLLNGRWNVLTNSTSTAESTFTMPGMMPHRMTARVTSESKPVTMKPFHVVFFHFLK